MTWTTISLTPHELGEGARLIDGAPHWVNLLAGELYAYRDGETVLVRKEAAPLGFADRAPDGTLIGILGTSLVSLAGDARAIGDTGLDLASNRVNDGDIAADGSVWFGTMAWQDADGEGFLWRFDPATGETTREIDGLAIPNGPTFLPDGESFLLADSPRGVIYEVPAAAPENRRVFANVEGGSPDGIHVDAEGRIWNAVWGGSRVDVYDRAGALLLSIEVPVSQPTSVLVHDGHVYVTSATEGLAAPTPYDGHTLMAPLSDIF
jgi:sugar lactone lactonase YvrE